LAALSLAGRANQAEQAARNEEILNLSNQSAILIDHFKKMSVEVENLTGLYGRMSGVLKGSPLAPDGQQQQQGRQQQPAQRIDFVSESIRQNAQQRRSESNRSFKKYNQKKHEGLTAEDIKVFQSQFGAIAPEEFARQTINSQARGRVLGLINARQEQRTTNVDKYFGNKSGGRFQEDQYLAINRQADKERMMLDQRGPQGFIEGLQRAERMRREMETRQEENRRRQQMTQGYNPSGGQAPSAIRPAAPALGGMSNTFNADQLRMIQSALAPFVNAVQMLKRMPTTIDVAVNDVSVSVNHNGLEVFSQIETKVTEMITQNTAKALIDYDRNIHSGEVLAFS
jgi:hypothetical protein